MPASRKIKSFGQSDADLDKLLAGMDRSQDLALRMLDMSAAAKAQPSPLTLTRSQFRSKVRGAAAGKGKGI